MFAVERERKGKAGHPKQSTPAMGSVSGDEHSQDETMACLESGFQVPSTMVNGSDKQEPSPLEGPYDYSIKVQPNALLVCMQR